MHREVEPDPEDQSAARLTRRRAVLADFGSKNLGVIVEETSRDLGAVPDQACETKLPSAFDVLMGMRRSYTHLPKPRFVSSVNVYTSTHQAYR